MTRTEYEEKIYEIIERLKQCNSDGDRVALDELKKYKPFRLGWQVADTMYRWNIDSANTWPTVDFGNLYSEITKYPFINEVQYMEKKEFEKLSNNILVGRICNAKKLMDGNLDFYNNLYDVAENAMRDYSFENDTVLYNEIFKVSDWISYVIRQKARQKRFEERNLGSDNEWILNGANMGDLLLALEDDNVFVLFENEENSPYIRYLANDLGFLGKKVFVITEAVILDVQNVNIIDTVAISFENVEKTDKYTLVRPIELIYENGIHENNVEYILEYVLNMYCENFMANVLANDEMTNALETSPISGKKFTRLAGDTYYGVYSQGIVFSKYGDYLSYISKIYNENCYELVDRKPTKKFSIVLPARNSIATLKSTIDTCLNQEFDGSYEIIVSDNSTNGNETIKEMCDELNDDRIVYIKTPRDLRLTKSFEYAYLHANGEYVMALGSDDGALPWLLSTLDKVVKEYPDEEIIQWERGAYAWPEYKGGQGDMLVIPRDYKYEDLNIYYRDRVNYIASVLNNNQSMYGLPLLYINSCFKRSYLKTLIEKTGRLWDGICQDIDMGIITVALHDKILNIQYPLTIAGTSSASAGAASNRAKKTKEEAKKQADEFKVVDNVGGYGKTLYERLIPQTLTDVNLLYSSFLRAISRNILPEKYITDVIDWKKWYTEIAKLLDINDVEFDRKIHEMQYTAGYHGEEFVKWFNENIYEVLMTPKYCDENIANNQYTKSYSVGRTAAGSLILDASEYGVSDIKGAVDFFANYIRGKA